MFVYLKANINDLKSKDKYIRVQNMKTNGRRKAQFCTLLTSALEWGECLASRPLPATGCIGGRVGSTASLHT